MTGQRWNRNRQITTGHPPNGFVVLASGITLGPVFIALLTFLIGAGLGSTMPGAQTMVQWAAGEKRLGVGTAVVSLVAPGEV
jgi:hypothetical protein